MSKQLTDFSGRCGSCIFYEPKFIQGEEVCRGYCLKHLVEENKCNNYSKLCTNKSSKCSKYKRKEIGMQIEDKRTTKSYRILRELNSGELFSLVEKHTSEIYIKIGLVFNKDNNSTSIRCFSLTKSKEVILNTDEPCIPLHGRLIIED